MTHLWRRAEIFREDEDPQIGDMCETCGEVWTKREQLDALDIEGFDWRVRKLTEECPSAPK